MRICFKWKPTYMQGVLAITNYGRIFAIDNELVIDYNQATFHYSYALCSWYKEEFGVVHTDKEIKITPIFDFEYIEVVNNNFFNCLAKDDCHEFTEDELHAYIIDFYRRRREEKCFPIINRGQAWYNHLSITQKVDLNDWYEAWLDVTVTLTEPKEPVWLHERINKIEPEELL